MSHFDRLFISTDFIKSIMETASAAVIEEDENPLNNSKRDALYPAIVQDFSELLMMLAIPTEHNVKLDSVKDILPKVDGQALELPEWAKPLIKVSQLLHFFRKEKC